MVARLLAVASASAALVLLVSAPAGAAQQGSIAGRWALDGFSIKGFGTDTPSTVTPDASGNGLDGTVLGAVLGPGRFGSAATFPNIDGYPGITVPQTSQLEPAQVTLMAWVRRDGAAGLYEYVAAKGAQEPCLAASYGLYTGNTGGLQFYITRGNGQNPVFSPERAPASIWDGAWHGVAGVFDGTRVRLYVDGEEIGTGGVAPSGIGYGLSDGEFTIGNYARASPCASNTRFKGELDEVRVYDRALSAAELQPLLTEQGATPPGLPAPDPGTPGAGGTPPAPAGTAPRVTAITSARPVVAGRPAVLNAAVDGAVDHLDWDLNADGKTDASCPGSQTTLAFRPSALAAAGGARAAAAFGATATVRAVSAAGTTTFTQTITAARAPAIASAALGRVADALAKKPVLACGLAKDLVAAAAARQPFPLPKRGADFTELLRDRCQEQTLIPVGVMRVSGCLTPIRSAQQIPAAERGSINPLLDIGRVQSRADIIAGVEAPAGVFIEQALDYTEAYISRQPVIVNGVTLTPQRNGRIIIFPQVDRIFSSDATMSVAGINIAKPGFDPAKPRAFQLNTRGTNGFGRIPLGTFQRLPGGTRSFAGFDLTGDVGLTLVAGGGSQLTAKLQLPPFLDIVGVDTNKPVTISVTPDGRPTLDGLTIGPVDAELGPIGVDALTLTYTGATREWKGTGELCVKDWACLNATDKPGQPPPPGGVIIRDGQLVRLGASLIFPAPGIPLFTGVELTRVGALVGLDPLRFGGGIGVTAAGIFQINGAVVIAFPSAAAPFTLTRGEVGNSFPPEFYGQKFPTLTMAIGADASLKVPYIDTSVRLGGAYFLYSAPAYVAFGGGIDADFFDVLTIQGGANGEFNLGSGKFNLAGRVQVCVVDIICAGAVGYVSSAGVGACVNVDTFIGDINIGGGVRYNPFDIYIWPFDGCRWTRFAETNVRGASAAQAGKPIEVKLADGDRPRAIRLEGATGAPRVRITTPDGKTLDSPDKPGISSNESTRILRSDEVKTTVLGITDPRPGTYTITELPGSPPITKSSEAEDQPKAAISAEVAAAPAAGPASAAAAGDAGDRRTLRYDIRRRKDQRVRFVDIGPGGSRELGTIAGGGKGTLTFTAVPGSGIHRIEAQFQLAGLEAERVTVARFRPPPTTLERPQRVAVRRRGRAVTVSWPRVPGATRYEVVATAASGEQRVTTTRRRTARLTGMPTGSGGRVTVRATASLRLGTGRTVAFRATTGRAPTRFAALPRLRVVR